MSLPMESPVPTQGAGEAPASFWAWSVSVYLRPAVADHCLALQDNIGADVNLLLWCCWTAAHHEAPLTPELLREAEALLAPVADGLTRPLRAARRQVKTLAGVVDDAQRRRLREKILEAELDAERLEQTLLEGLALRRLGTPVRRADGVEALRARARASLAVYARALGLDGTNAEACHRLVSLVSAAF
ncbi:MAG: TIGR02444 family protein [Alphaproteobacteria bacterium]|nr:TIGR02444 family protein [Alphaproteobacteria bacterium]